MPKSLSMTSFIPKDLTTPVLHHLLLSAVAPRPIAFASTISAKAEPNLSPFSFFNVFSANPPILVFSPALRGTDGTKKDTLHNIEAVNEVVINVVNHSIVHQMSLSSTAYPKGTNEFDKSGLTMLASDTVKPFRVAEAPVQFECKVNEIKPLGTGPGAGNLVICEVLKIHIHNAVLNKDNTINQDALDLVSRAGGSYYNRAKSGFFEIPKPLSRLGIGVDAMPSHIKNSTVLTGNDLGMLANVEALPHKDAVDSFINDLSKRCPEVAKASLTEKHKAAQKYLSRGEVQSAWKLLLS